MMGPNQNLGALPALGTSFLFITTISDHCQHGEGHLLVHQTHDKGKQNQI